MLSITLADSLAHMHIDGFHAEDNGLGGLIQRNVDVPKPFFEVQIDRMYSEYLNSQGKQVPVGCLAQ